jgi:hypothetical protein
MLDGFLVPASTGAMRKWSSNSFHEDKMKLLRKGQRILASPIAATIASAPRAFSRSGVGTLQNDPEAEPSSQEAFGICHHPQQQSSLIQAEMVDDAMPVVVAKNIERDDYRRQVIATVLVSLLGCIILVRVLRL